MGTSCKISLLILQVNKQSDRRLPALFKDRNFALCSFAPKYFMRQSNSSPHALKTNHPNLIVLLCSPKFHFYQYRYIIHIFISTYDHRLRRTGHPVRSAIHKPQIGRSVVGWVTTSESLLLYVFEVLSLIFLYFLLRCLICVFWRAVPGCGGVAGFES